LVAAALTQLRIYQQLTGDNQYAEMEAALRDWLFGCNPWGTSMIVGYPEDGDTPVDPHSALTAVFNFDIDGGLVDGPVYSSIFNRLRGLRIVNGDEYAEFQSELCVYHDDYGDYSTNEPTMDGTASLTFYLSSLENHDRSPKNIQMRHGAIVRGDTTAKKIHLVFTGHEFSEGGKHIRNVLKNKGIPAHFFFTGDFYRNRANKKLIEQLRKDGHYLGAHSDKHLLYATWENRDSLLVDKSLFISDLKNNYREMARFGITPKDAPFFLPPYEWYNRTIAKWTRELGLTLINFSHGTRSNADYTWPEMGDKYVNSEVIYQSILDYERTSPNGLNGFILLLHIGTDPARTDKFYLKLENLIDELMSKGYQFSTIAF
ncbi:MAG: glycoside hydrolase family 9 protein, partial [Calditrichaeota bacterium]|nr:glycoside hydrolase family 9 protein [Calditrichota bacterium]